MTLEDSGEEVASPEDAGAEAAEEDALEDSGAEAGAREAGVLEAGAEQAASIRARTAARRIERFFHENHLNRKKHRNQQGAGVNAFLSKVGWSTPTFLTILRTFGRKENAGTVCGLAGVFQRRIAIHSALQLDDDFQRLQGETAATNCSLWIVKNRGDFYNKSDCCEQTGGRVSEAGGKRMRKQMNFKMAVLILVGIVLLLQVMGALGIGVQKSSANLQIGYWEKSSAQSWSADYVLWDGWQQRTLHPTTQPATLHVTVQTDAGSCALQIESADGEILFEQEDLPTSAFDVEVPGDVVVRFTADRHKGGFSAEILE